MDFVSVSSLQRPPRDDWQLSRCELLPVPPEGAWKALTTPALLKQWWCDEAAVDGRVGGTFAFWGSTVFGTEPPAAAPAAAWDPSSKAREITVWEPGRRLQFRWPMLGADTLVTIDLENDMEQTRLRVVQSAPDNPGWPHENDFPNWWWVGLAALRSYVETGRPSLRVRYDRCESREIRLFADFTQFPWVIWDKLTQPGELSRWWGFDVEVDEKAGGAYRLGLTGYGPRKVLEVQPGERLVHDWTWASDVGEHAIDQVTWQIEEIEDVTRVSLATQTSDAVSAAVSSRAAWIYWCATLLSLKQVSERGIAPREYQSGPSG